MSEVTHAFVNPKADGPDATITRPSDWNANHDLHGETLVPAGGLTGQVLTPQGWASASATGPTGAGGPTGQVAQSSASTAGIKIGFSGPTGASLFASVGGTAITGTQITPVTLNAFNTATGIFMIAAAFTGVILARGFVLTGATGAAPMQAQFSKVSSATGTIYSGSNLKMKRVV